MSLESIISGSAEATPAVQIVKQVVKRTGVTLPSQLEDLPERIKRLLDPKSMPDEIRKWLDPEKSPLTKIIPSAGHALSDLIGPSSAEIEAVWWSDGFEIWAGQAAAKHVRGFGSLFGHQARVELDGVPYGNNFPLSYCLTFTGYVNPVGPIFEELRGAVLLGPDGTAKGKFCERANRDRDRPDPVKTFSKSQGYLLEYDVSKT